MQIITTAEICLVESIENDRYLMFGAGTWFGALAAPMLHWMQTIVTSDVCLSVCRTAQRGFTVQKRLSRSGSCLDWTLSGAQGTFCWTGVLPAPQWGGFNAAIAKLLWPLVNSVAKVCRAYCIRKPFEWCPYVCMSVNQDVVHRNRSTQRLVTLHTEKYWQCLIRNPN